MNTAIVLQAFGSSAAEHRQLRERVVAAYGRAFPGHAVHLSVLSQRVRAVEGLPSFDELLASLVDRGVTTVLLQHLLLIPGQMYAEAPHSHPQCQVLNGSPLLSGPDDVRRLAAHIHGQAQSEVPTIAVLHGNTSNPQHNAINRELQRELQALASPLILASLEGEPGPEPLIACRESARHCGGAHFIPVFLFPGGHVLEDILGEEPDSWVSRLGVPCTHSPTLLEQELIIQRFITHSRRALQLAG